MPAIGFICPDGDNICAKDCLNQCRLRAEYYGERCLPEGYLAACLRDKSRPTDIPSVTELVKPILQSVLEKKIDHFIDPRTCFDAIRGSSHHYFLEKVQDSGWLEPGRYLSEVRMRNDIFSGQIDVYDKKTGFLWDYKFVNSFKMKLLSEDIEKNSWDYVFQQNCYRILLNSEGYPVNKMMLFTGAYDKKGRDKNGQIAKTTDVIKVPFVEDKVIMSFAKEKAQKLSFFLDFYPDELPSKCEETWGDKRCKFYCPINWACPYFDDKD